MDPDVIFKLGGGGAVLTTAIYVIVKFMLLLEKWIEGRSNIDVKSAETAGRNFDEVIKMVSETNERSLVFMERSANIQSNIAKLISEESWQTSQHLNSLASDIRHVPVATQSIITPDITKIATELTEFSTKLGGEVIDRIDRNGSKIDRLTETLDRRFPVLQEPLNATS